MWIAASEKGPQPAATKGGGCAKARSMRECDVYSWPAACFNAPLQIGCECLLAGVHCSSGEGARQEPNAAATCRRAPALLVGPGSEAPHIHIVQIDAVEAPGFQRGHKLCAVLRGMVN